MGYGIFHVFDGNADGKCRICVCAVCRVEGGVLKTVAVMAYRATDPISALCQLLVDLPVPGLTASRLLVAVMLRIEGRVSHSVNAACLYPSLPPTCENIFFQGPERQSRP